MVRAARFREGRRQVPARNASTGPRAVRPHAPGALRRRVLRSASEKGTAGTTDGLAPPCWLARLVSTP